MVKRAKYIIKTTRHGNLTRQEITRVGPPDHPRVATTCTLPFEQIKHLLSSRPDDLGEMDAGGGGSKRGRGRGGNGQRGRKKRSR